MFTKESIDKIILNECKEREKLVIVTDVKIYKGINGTDYETFECVELYSDYTHKKLVEKRWFTIQDITNDYILIKKCVHNLNSNKRQNQLVYIPLDKIVMIKYVDEIKKGKI